MSGGIFITKERIWLEQELGSSSYCYNASLSRLINDASEKATLIKALQNPADSDKKSPEIGCVGIANGKTQTVQIYISDDIWDAIKVIWVPSLVNDLEEAGLRLRGLFLCKKLDETHENTTARKAMFLNRTALIESRWKNRLLIVAMVTVCLALIIGRRSHQSLYDLKTAGNLVSTTLRGFRLKKKSLITTPFLRTILEDKEVLLKELSVKESELKVRILLSTSSDETDLLQRIKKDPDYRLETDRSWCEEKGHDLDCVLLLLKKGTGAVE